MANQFNAVYERDGDWWIGYCLEVPEANGQGKTLEECRESLIEAIKLVFEERRETYLRGMPEDVIRETVEVP
jgi:predicted RNase H-like HicB family nuclease